MLAGRHPYNAFGVKIRQRLGYLLGELRRILAPKGCEFSFPAAVCISLRRRRPCAKGAGAPVSIGEWLPAPAAPSLDPPLDDVTTGVRNCEWKPLFGTLHHTSVPGVVQHNRPLADVRRHVGAARIRESRMSLGRLVTVCCDYAVQIKEDLLFGCCQT